jgi:hypothetical protein
LPQVRKRIQLDEWRWYGYKEGQHKSSMARIDAWNDRPGVEVHDEALVVTDKKTTLDIDLAGQPWRFFTEFRIKPSGKGDRTFAIIGDDGKTLLTAGIDQSGKVFYTTGGQKKQGPPCAAHQWHTFKLEVDLTNSDH